VWRWSLGENRLKRHQNAALNATLNATKTPPKHHQITACPRLTLKLKPAAQASDHKKA
jgi:hypothetical protein